MLLVCVIWWRLISPSHSNQPTVVIATATQCRRHAHAGCQQLALMSYLNKMSVLWPLWPTRLLCLGCSLQQSIHQPHIRWQWICFKSCYWRVASYLQFLKSRLTVSSPALRMKLRVQNSDAAVLFILLWNDDTDVCRSLHRIECRFMLNSQRVTSQKMLTTWLTRTMLYLSTKCIVQQIQLQIISTLLMSAVSWSLFSCCFVACFYR